MSFCFFLLLGIAIPTHQAETVLPAVEVYFTTVQGSEGGADSLVENKADSSEHESTNPEYGLGGDKQLFAEHEQEDAGNELEEYDEYLETDGEYEMTETADLVLFLGRFHPIFVHLPIGFLLFAFLLECVSSFKKYEPLNHAVPFALLMGILGGIAAGITGYMLSLGGGYGEDLVTSHKWFGIGMILLAVVAYIIRINWYDHPALRKAFRAILVLMTVAVMITGHYGGSLTHGSDYLFRYMPEPLRSLTGVELEEEEQIDLIENLDTAQVYNDIIHPILRTRCESCHNPDRKEGEFLMTTLDEIMEGGESGPAVVASNAGESELFKRLILPVRDEQRMPPRGRRQLTADQIKLLAWWIDQGVPSTQTVSEFELSDEMAGIMDKLTVGGQSFFARTEVPRVHEDSLEVIRQRGFRVSPIADGVHFLEVRLSNSMASLRNEDIESLLPFSEQITWLDFNRSEVTDNDLLMLSEFKHLTRLNLSNTNISNHTLEIISSLVNLEYLNIYGTKINDDGLKFIDHLHNLKSIYLWKTEVSQEAVEKLQDQNNDLYINFGV